MALFKQSKKENKKDEKTEVISSEDLSWVIKSPRITEKAAMLTSQNTYTFNVSVKANKVQIKHAVEQAYKVDVRKVNVSQKKARDEVRRNRDFHVRGTKKAMVTLKKGDTIELV